ncbi:hypothetical protein V6N13_022913 [Hibiscus sabdariffa]
MVVNDRTQCDHHPVRRPVFPPCCQSSVLPLATRQSHLTVSNIRLVSLLRWARLVLQKNIVGFLQSSKLKGFRLFSRGSQMATRSRLQ